MSNIPNLIAQNLKTLEIKLERIRSVTDHALSKGILLEKAVLDFFQIMLPNNLGITSGFVIDSNGNQSTQLDLIIYDKVKACSFFSEGGISVLPCEFVHCVIEVKTSINSTMLHKCAEAADQLKRLERKAFYKNSHPIIHEYNYYGKTYSLEATGSLPPPVYIIFSLETTVDLATLKNRLIELDIASVACIRRSRNTGSSPPIILFLSIFGIIISVQLKEVSTWYDTVEIIHLAPAIFLH